MSPGVGLYGVRSVWCDDVIFFSGAKGNYGAVIYHPGLSGLVFQLMLAVSVRVDRRVFCVSVVQSLQRTGPCEAKVSITTLNN